MADGGGGGGGGGGYEGGIGGVIIGGDDGAGSGNNGTNFLPAFWSAGIGSNGAALGTGQGGNGSIQITFPFSPPLTFYTLGNSQLLQSDIQILNIQNIGNQSVTVSEINYTNNRATAIVDYTNGANPITALPVTIPAGQFRDFTLAYSGNFVGTYRNSFSIISTADAGTLTVPTTQVISDPVFQVDLSPKNVDTVSTGNQVVTAINLESSGYNIFSYSASISGSNRFSLSTFNTGPQVTFSPTIFGSTGTFTTVLTVTAYNMFGTGQTTSTNITVTYSTATSYNLGTWASAAATNNAYVGISYDVINTTPYLTVGVGSGGDGGPEIVGGGISYGLSLNDLGAAADVAYNQGPVLFAATDAAWGAFLNDYGASVAYQGQVTATVVRSYTFSAPSTRTYNYSFSVTETGYFTVDDILYGDARNTADPATKELSGSMTLTSGAHTIKFYSTNVLGKNAIGIRIYNPDTNATIWSTRNPIRSQPAYQNWREVYRIPLTQGSAVYSSSDYYIKNPLAALGRSYGSYFGDGDFFVVRDDGLGNLRLTFNFLAESAQNLDLQNTLVNLQYVPYYFVPNTILTTRFSQIGSATGDGSQTQFLLGFDRFGNVNTSLVRIPTVPPDYNI